MDFKLEFNMDNAAFKEYPEHEIHRILNLVASVFYLKREGIEFPVFVTDFNGNVIGKFEVTE